MGSRYTAEADWFVWTAAPTLQTSQQLSPDSCVATEASISPPWGSCLCWVDLLQLPSPVLHNVPTLVYTFRNHETQVETAQLL